MTAISSHFNLHVSGVGYLNRVRWVYPSQKEGRRADPFLCCAISALRGNSNQPDCTYLDLRVSGQEAIQMVERLQEDVEQKRKVFISFRVGDIYPHLYERDAKDPSGRKTGQRETAAIIKGRLLALHSITIDGVSVYRRDSNADVDAVSHAGETSSLTDDSNGYGKKPAAPVQTNPTRGAPTASRSQVRPQRTAFQTGHAADPTARRMVDAVSYAEETSFADESCGYDKPTAPVQTHPAGGAPAASGPQVRPQRTAFQAGHAADPTARRMYERDPGANVDAVSYAEETSFADESCGYDKPTAPVQTHPAGGAPAASGPQVRPQRTAFQAGHTAAPTVHQDSQRFVQAIA